MSSPTSEAGGDSPLGQTETHAGSAKARRRRSPSLLYLGEPAEEFGRFRIRGEIGRGGFGIVYLADDPLLGRAVALKLPRPEALADAELRQRFLREARAAAALEHPNLVPVYESGEVEGVCYLASAYCPGGNLAQWLHEHPGPLSPWTAAALIACVAEAVHHAHSRGILHRDLKPSNILLVPRTSADMAADDPLLTAKELDFIPKLTDFGLAKLLETEPDQTRSGVILGTPAYMAPEQAEGWVHAVGATTDIFALGVVLFELLTRRLPFQGASLLHTLDQLRNEEPLKPRQLDATLPRDLETICLKCLRKEPGQRYPSAAALVKDLRRFLRSEPIQARPAGLGTRLRDWCRHPQRIRDAAVAALFVGFAAGFTCSVGLLLFLCGVLPSDRPIAAAAMFLMGISTDGLALIWLARRTSRHDLFALWAGVFLPLVYPAYLAGSLFHWIDTGGMAEGESSLQFAQVTTAIFLNGIVSISYLCALLAYHANRHRPGFSPLPSLPPTEALHPS